MFPKLHKFLEDTLLLIEFFCSIFDFLFLPGSRSGHNGRLHLGHVPAIFHEQEAETKGRGGEIIYARMFHIDQQIAFVQVRGTYAGAVYILR